MTIFSGEKICTIGREEERQCSVEEAKGKYFYTDIVRFCKGAKYVDVIQKPDANGRTVMLLKDINNNPIGVLKSILCKDKKTFDEYKEEYTRTKTLGEVEEHIIKAKERGDEEVRGKKYFEMLFEYGGPNLYHYMENDELSDIEVVTIAY